MKVEATKTGYYNGLREVGEVFDIKDESDIGSWMVKIEESDPPKKPGRKPKPEEFP